jgi:hypothetical protein
VNHKDEGKRLFDGGLVVACSDADYEWLKYILMARMSSIITQVKKGYLLFQSCI